MGAMMTENCAGCGFEFSSGELFEHEQACEVLLRDRLEDAKSALSARDAEVARLRALVEKRERQLVWIVQKYASGGGFTHPPKQHWFKLPHGDGSVMEYDGTDAGLLAAIDEATGDSK